jgi:hypothetical protein
MELTLPPKYTRRSIRITHRRLRSNDWLAGTQFAVNYSLNHTSAFSSKRVFDGIGNILRLCIFVGESQFLR